jgi:hypothetical protein
VNVNQSRIESPCCAIILNNLLNIVPNTLSKDFVVKSKNTDVVMSKPSSPGGAPDLLRGSVVITGTWSEIDQKSFFEGISPVGQDRIQGQRNFEALAKTHMSSQVSPAKRKLGRQNTGVSMQSMGNVVQTKLAQSSNSNLSIESTFHISEIILKHKFILQKVSGHSDFGYYSSFVRQVIKNCIGMINSDDINLNDRKYYLLENEIKEISKLFYTMNYEFGNYFNLFEKDFYTGLLGFTTKKSPEAGVQGVSSSFDQKLYQNGPDNGVVGSPTDDLQTFSGICSKNASKRALWKPEEKPKLKHACSNDMNGYAEFRTDKISKKTDTPGL